MSALRLTIWSARVLGVATAILGWLFLLADSSIATWIARVPAIGTQLQEWLSWIANSTSFIFTHMLLGITFALLLLALSLIELLTVLGFTQTGLLVGPMHWLIQTAHVVIGFGALVLVQVISVRDARLRRSAAIVPVPRTMVPRGVR